MYAVLLALCVLFAAGCTRDGTAPPVPESPLERGQLYTEWLYEGETERLWDRFTPGARAGGSLRSFRSFQAEIRRGMGTERAILSERVVGLPGFDLYQRMARFSGTADTVVVEWMIESSGDIAGLGVGPRKREAPTAFAGYTTQAGLRLPFAGDWFVVWGGRTTLDNYHAAYPDQRFAYDLVVVRGGASYTGDPSRNESYFCFGEPILAPAGGTVRAAVDGVPDNRPGQLNGGQPLGNHVIVDHGGGEFSFLVHLRQGSVAVQAGSTVREGQPVGSCGNSGNSTEPHLHYHLQNTAEFGKGQGLPAPFMDYLADGVAVARGEPLRGQRIRSRG